ncbi:MAG TPA: putative cytokinetic ring protein SteA [Aeromicrobium sp.]|nr:putative cytokinetic ring protein SteA [Aeromicrobium sp.]
MPILKRRKNSTPDGPGVAGPVRLCRTSDELSVVRTGDIVVVDIADLEADHARLLVDRKVAAVVNVSASTSGRFPNLGPQVLAEASIPLVDRVGESLWQSLRSGDRARIFQGQIFVGDKLIATGTEMTAGLVRDQLDEASSGLSSRLDSIVTNAADTLRRDRAMLLEGAGIPAVVTPIRNKPVVIVYGGKGAASELKSIRRFISDNDPVLVAVAAGAELLLNAGLRPNLVVDRADQLSERVIDRARELVVVSPVGRLANPERFEKQGQQPVIFASAGAPENLALLLVDQFEAAVIVQVGGSARLLDLVESDAADAAGSFITRLRAGSRVVDAPSVAWFASQRIGWFTPIILLVAGVAAVVAAVATTSVGSDWVSQISTDLTSWIEGVFS